MQGIIHKAKACSIPEHSQEIPTFRTGVVNPTTRRVDAWRFWNGEREWKVDEIT